jgi:hypothetical protein
MVCVQCSFFCRLYIIYILFKLIFIDIEMRDAYILCSDTGAVMK